MKSLITDTKAKQRITWFWLCLLLVASLPFRFLFFDFVSIDYQMFLRPWYDFIAANGGFKAFQYDFSPYGLLYLYLLVVATWLPLEPIYAIKIISVFFDYLAAYYIYKIVRLKYGKTVVPVNAACIALLLPTVILNSSVWGQCDIIYACSFLACLYWMLIKRPTAAMYAFGVACSLKPQAVFFAPFICGLTLGGLIPWRLVFVPPSVYLLSGVPALLFGKPIQDVLLNHTRLGNPPRLTLAAPNIYQFVLEDHYTILRVTGIIVTAIVGAWLIWSMTLWFRRSDAESHPASASRYTVAARAPDISAPKMGTELESEVILTTALISTLIVPYFLPGMHERYFFPADLISLIYVFYYPRRFLVAILIQFASFFSYFDYLFRTDPIPLPLLAIPLTIALEIVIADYNRMTLAPEPGRTWKVVSV